MNEQKTNNTTSIKMNRLKYYFTIFKMIAKFNLYAWRNKLCPIYQKKLHLVSNESLKILFYYLLQIVAKYYLYLNWI